MKVSEAISNALGRAQNLTFAVFSAALIVAVVSLTSLSESSNALTRVNKEYAAISNVANHSDNVIREIRRYALAKLPSSTSEEEALRNIRHAFSSAYVQAGLTSDHLLKGASEISLPLLMSVNAELDDIRDVYGAVRSVNVDLAPYSVILSDQLENLRFRDLAVFAHLISVDPISLNDVLSRSLRSWMSTSPRTAAERLLTDLEEIRSGRQKAAFEQIGHYGTSLRKACEEFGEEYGHLATGGLQSTHTRAQAKLIELHNERGSIQDRLSGRFQINVPIIDQSLPISIVVLFFPLALVGGYGLINTSLLFARRKLLSIRDVAKRTEAADCGFVFDQLHAGGRLSRTLNLLLVLVIAGAPLVAAAVLACQFTSALHFIMNVLMATFLLVALAVLLRIVITAFQISAMARGS